MGGPLTDDQYGPTGEGALVARQECRVAVDRLLPAELGNRRLIVLQEQIVRTSVTCKIDSVLVSLSLSLRRYGQNLAIGKEENWNSVSKTKIMTKF